MYRIANPITYIAHKLLVSDQRKPHERAKDLLYIHDTLELFARSIPELRRTWIEDVRPQLNHSTQKKVQLARQRLFGAVTDPIRDATLMAIGRVLSPEELLEVCQAGIDRILAPRQRSYESIAAGIEMRLARLHNNEGRLNRGSPEPDDHRPGMVD